MHDPSGEARLATREDATLLVDWQRAFVVEVHVGFAADIEAMVRAAIDAGRVWLWVDGDPRSTTVQHPAVGGVVRIGVVYTPPAYRGHGYARRLVHDMSAAALRAPEVRSCALTTDATNPVSKCNVPADRVRPGLRTRRIRAHHVIVQVASRSSVRAWLTDET